jgi:hypothetical protein
MLITESELKYVIERIINEAELYDWNPRRPGFNKGSKESDVRKKSLNNDKHSNKVSTLLKNINNGIPIEKAIYKAYNATGAPITNDDRNMDYKKYFTLISDDQKNLLIQAEKDRRRKLKISSEYFDQVVEKMRSGLKFEKVIEEMGVDEEYLYSIFTKEQKNFIESLIRKSYSQLKHQYLHK